jgi:hypothetical protein
LEQLPSAASHSLSASLSLIAQDVALQELIVLWPSLPRPIVAAILALVRAVESNTEEGPV